MVRLSHHRGYCGQEFLPPMKRWKVSHKELSTMLEGTPWLTVDVLAGEYSRDWYNCYRGAVQ